MPSSNDSFTTSSNSYIAAGAYKPIVTVGSYVGSGSSFSITLSKTPDFFIIKGAGKAAVYHARFGWYGRSNYLVNADSAYLLSLTSGGVSITSNSNVNALGVTYHWIAISDNDSGFFSQTAWIGNAKDNRKIDVTNIPIEFLFVKRDNPLPACFFHKYTQDSACLVSTGGTAAHVRRIADGGFVVSSGANGNENNGPATVGEGIEGFAFCKSNISKVIHWTGDGSTSRVLPVGVTPAFALLTRDDGAAPLPEFVFKTMSSGASAPISTAANNTGRVQGISSAGITLSDSTWNETGVVYTALCIAESSSNVSAQPTASGKYLSLSGSGSGIRHGKNANLSGVSSGAFTLEWYGKRISTGVIVPLWLCGNGSYNGTQSANAGEFSYGLYLYPPVDPYNHGWVGDTFRVIQGNYMASTLTESNTNYYSWNTGVVAPTGDMHVMLSHNGVGRWRLWVDGRLAKQRDMDMTAFAYGTRTNAGTGLHDSVLGAQIDAADTMINSANVTLYGKRIYKRELSLRECIVRYKKSVLGLPISDVQPYEAWDFSADSGSTLLAQNSSSNNAVIYNGTWGNRS